MSTTIYKIFLSFNRKLLFIATKSEETKRKMSLAAINRHQTKIGY